MWMLFGFGAIAAVIFNLAFYVKGREPKWFRFSGLSLTALTVCAFYSDGASRVLSGDWGGLMDIMPTMSVFLWICVGISIILNGISLLPRK